MNKILIAVVALVFGFFVEYNFKVIEHAQNTCPACHVVKSDCCQQGKCCSQKKCEFCKDCTCCTGCVGNKDFNGKCTCPPKQCECCPDCVGKETIGKK